MTAVQPDIDTQDEGLDDLLRRVDPDRWLSSRFIGDLRARAGVEAVYAFDHELARAPRVASNPLLGEMRLAWWREVLDEAFEARAVRRHPTAQALAAAIAGHGLARPSLEALIDARYRELDEAPMDAAEALEFARETGGGVAVLAARILDPAHDPEPARAAGALWALWKRDGDDAALRAEAKRGASRLTPAGFPAVAHAALARGRAGSDLGRRLRITWAVARGRV